MRVIGVYAPNKINERIFFFLHLEKYLQFNEVTVLMGNFNCVFSAEDRVPFKTNSDQSAAVLSEILSKYNLEDVAKLAAPRNEFKFTHFQLSSHARSDWIYVSAELSVSISGYDVKPLFFSDHCLVAVTLGKGGKPSCRFNWELWKINVSLLKDEIFVSGVKRALDETFFH